MTCAISPAPRFRNWRPNSGHAQLGPVLQKQPRSRLASPDRIEVSIQSRSLASRLCRPPFRHGVQRYGRQIVLRRLG